jgi:dipeptidyl aminopeptidase/acylaminoacyl peptidase
MVEYVSYHPDGRKILACANTGPDVADIDRRHIIEIDLKLRRSQVRTPGPGNEWAPQYISDSENFTYISASAQQPPLVAVRLTTVDEPKMVTESLVPSKFPQARLVTPTPVIYKAPDGTPIHAMLFKPNRVEAKMPAIIYVHGGPPRQMLLGWHYSSYYANAYAINQYLASQVFEVMSVNYR